MSSYVSSHKINSLVTVIEVQLLCITGSSALKFCKADIFILIIITIVSLCRVVKK